MEQPLPLIFRTARVLIGWLNPHDGALWLAGRNEGAINPDLMSKVEQARARVAERPPYRSPDDAITKSPPELDIYVEEFWKSPGTQPFAQEKWEVAVADLSKVCAVQPSVTIEQSIERTSNLDSSNILSLASVSLPKPTPSVLPAQFDNTKNTWVFSSANPNLRIQGNFSGPVGQGLTGFGFIVGIPHSFLQVAYCRGRYILRDGYHRAFGFLSNGIAKVPVLTRTFNTFSEMTMPAGMIVQEEVFGERPPLLPDYLDDSVSAQAKIPTLHKTVVIQGLDFSTLG